MMAPLPPPSAPTRASSESSDFGSARRRTEPGEPDAFSPVLARAQVERRPAHRDETRSAGGPSADERSRGDGNERGALSRASASSSDEGHEPARSDRPSSPEPPARERARELAREDGGRAGAHSASSPGETTNTGEGATTEGEQPTGDSVVGHNQDQRLGENEDEGLTPDLNLAAGTDVAGTVDDGARSVATGNPAAGDAEAVAAAGSDKAVAEQQPRAELVLAGPRAVDSASTTAERTAPETVRADGRESSEPTSAAEAEPVQEPIVGAAPVAETAPSSEADPAPDTATASGATSGRQSDVSSSATAAQGAAGQQGAATSLAASPEALSEIGPEAGPDAGLDVRPGALIGAASERTPGLVSGRSAAPDTVVDSSAASSSEVVAAAIDTPSVGQVSAVADGTPDRGADRAALDAGSRTINLPADVSVERAERPAAAGAAASSAAVELSEGATEELWGQVQRALHRARVGPTGSELRLRLRPAELGELLVQVRTVGDQLAVRLVTSSLSAQQVLVNDQSRLAAELAAAGFDDGSFDISHQGQPNGDSGSNMDPRSDSEQQPSARPIAAVASVANGDRLDRSIANTNPAGRRSTVELKL